MHHQLIGVPRGPRWTIVLGRSSSTDKAEHNYEVSLSVHLLDFSMFIMFVDYSQSQRPSIHTSNAISYSFAFMRFASSSCALTFNSRLKILPLALFGISSTNLTPPLNLL